MGSFLEIDESLLTEKLLFTPPESEELETLFPAPPQKSTKITPKPGICIKCKYADINRKLFINVCISEHVPAPEDIKDDELILILESEEPSAFKVPMSIGSLCEEKDKRGEECSACDIVINSEFLTKVNDNPLFHNFFVIASIEGLEAKYSIKLNKNDWTVLKNKKYHGSLPDQTIRTPFPVVQELCSNAASISDASKLPSQNRLLIKEVSTKYMNSIGSVKKNTESAFKRKVEICENKKELPKYNITEKAMNGSMIFEIDINLPDSTCGKQIELNIGNNILIMESPKHYLELNFKKTIKNNTCKAYFHLTEKVLYIYTPIINGP